MLLDIALFLRAIWKNWMSLTSGVASVILAALGAVGRWAIPAWAFWVAASMCLLIASFHVWRAEHRIVTDLQTTVPPRIRIHGEPTVLHEHQKDFFIVPVVSITNNAHGNRLSLGVRLCVAIVEGGEACLAPDTQPLRGWEVSRRQSANQIIVFPLNLEPRQTAHGYIAFRGEIPNGAIHELASQSVCLRYYGTRIEFIDYTSEPPERVIYSDEIRFNT
jgi:hypothetical protein